MSLVTILSLLATVIGLALFETISSIDNAIINADVLRTMGGRARRWFLTWGMFVAVFCVRGLLPLVIVWLVTPFGLWDSITATFSSDPAVLSAFEHSAPILLMGGGVFLILLFLHWLFLEEKHYGLIGESFFHRNGVWFYASASVFLTTLVWFALAREPMLAMSAVVGSTAFFITHGFKEQAEQAEQQMLSAPASNGHMGASSDIAKVLYLEAIDATFSIDGVLGAFAFTLAVPLILLGNGLGALVVRQLTLHNIERVRKYVFLKNGAMYSILFLGIIMVAEGFGAHIPALLSPLITFAVVGYFLVRSHRLLTHDDAETPRAGLA